MSLEAWGREGTAEQWETYHQGRNSVPALSPKRSSLAIGLSSKVLKGQKSRRERVAQGHRVAVVPYQWGGWAWPSCLSGRSSLVQPAFYTPLLWLISFSFVVIASKVNVGIGSAQKPQTHLRTHYWQGNHIILILLYEKKGLGSSPDTILISSITE